MPVHLVSNCLQGVRVKCKSSQLCQIGPQVWFKKSPLVRNSDTGNFRNARKTKQCQKLIASISVGADHFLRMTEFQPGTLNWVPGKSHLAQTLGKLNG